MVVVGTHLFVVPQLLPLNCAWVTTLTVSCHLQSCTTRLLWKPTVLQHILCHWSMVKQHCCPAPLASCSRLLGFMFVTAGKWCRTCIVRKQTSNTGQWYRTTSKRHRGAGQCFGAAGMCCNCNTVRGVQQQPTVQYSLWLFSCFERT